MHNKAELWFERMQLRGLQGNVPVPEPALWKVSCDGAGTCASVCGASLVRASVQAECSATKHDRVLQASAFKPCFFKRCKSAFCIKYAEICGKSYFGESMVFECPHIAIV